MTKAVVATAFGGPDVLSVVDVDVPDPREREVTIDVRAAAVNPFDYKVYSGAFGRRESMLPMRLGMEVSGVVTAVGDDAVGPAGPLAVGDEVIGYPVEGGYAAELTATASAVYPSPRASAGSRRPASP